jgi:hypothetical protein
MKIIILFLALSSYTLLFGQDKLITKTGKISFEASVPAFEEVKATNNGVTCVLNSKTGEIASLALVKGFRFKLALMEEHFNENYIESDKFPKSTFRGTIEDFDVTNLSASVKEFKMNGKLELHGKVKAISSIAKIKKTGAGIEIKSDFFINADDFDIEIPAIVKSKVSNKISLKTEFIVQ